LVLKEGFLGELFFRRSHPAAEGCTLLCIHGLGDSGLAFQALAHREELRSFNFWIVDLPGYGKSPAPENPFSLEEHAEALGARLAEAGIGRTVVVGHSMGGVVGLMLCEKHPEQVSGFVNIEGNISPDDCMFSAKVAEYPKEEWLESGVERFLDVVYRSGLEDRALRGYYAGLRFCDPRTLYLDSAGLVEVSRGGGLAERLAALSVPVVYLLGRPRGTGAHSRSLLERAGIEWRAIEDAGHWTFVDQPAATAGEIVRFVNARLPSLSA
jgi:pimeloyl-ACP methyl ester carboxylesterase